MLNRQINFFTKVIGTTLLVFGVISAIAQVAKLFLVAEEKATTILALFLSILFIILGTNKILTRLVKLALHYRFVTKLFIFCLPIIFSISFILLRVIMGYETWRSMNTEGGFIEYGTSLAFLLAAIFAFPIGKYFFAIEQKLMGYLYYFISAGFFFVGMEEISWGQKLLGFESSEFFQTYNSQEEITLHNLVWVNEYMDKGVMFAGLLAGISWLFYSLISKFKSNYRIKYIIPRWFLSSFFLIVFLFFYLIEYIQTWNSTIATFQEAVELIFSLGCLCFIISNFWTTDKLQPKSSDLASKMQ